ncbi:uncharacterized protein LOC143426656 [Xylocopa sonorina]|uniref:uncharacterized protein LOC143426656 n=1 Tax=Xylocopa sonorina TaxID=1818115 RepID=UPI00403B0FDA
MGSMNWIVLCIVIIINGSNQQPIFFKNIFKGLNGVLPNVEYGTNEIRAVYYYEQTVAVVDLGNNNELHDCNLIEVYEPEEANEVLRNLSLTTTPQLVSFKEMRRLMEQCELLDKIQHESVTSSADTTSKGNRGISNVWTLFSGVVPGTKWCGAGDIAENYHDLGEEFEIDRCCRTHDLCPVKVRAQRSRYNLTNYSIYTKSHCTCDEGLYNCLKATSESTARIIGHIYFNVLRVPCIEDVPPNEQTSTGLDRQFIPVTLKY